MAKAKQAAVSDGATGVQLIALDQLVISPRNVRQYASSGIDELAENIRQQGLIQNLTATDAGNGKAEVVAGGRRLRALNRLVELGQIKADHPVPVRFVQADEAQAVSLAENQMRQAMSPIEQFQAFAKLVEDGAAAADVAARYGVTTTFVAQRMKLAKLAPEVLDALTNEHITLDQAEAITTAKSIEHQLQVLPEVINSRMSAHVLRRKLAGARVDQRDHRVKFVGVDAIEASDPAAVVRSLFDDDVLIIDDALIDRLATEKLVALAAQIKAEEGWAWAEGNPDWDWRDTDRCGRVYPEQKPLDEASRQRLEAIHDELEELASDDTEDWSQEQEQHYSDLEDEAGRIKDQAWEQGYSPEQKAKSGAVVTISYDGKPEILRGLVRAEDAHDLDPESKPPKGRAVSKKARPKQDPAGTMTEAAAVNLSAHHTVALQLAVAHNPALALRLTAWRLINVALLNNDNTWPVLLELELPNRWRMKSRLEQASESVTTSPAGQALAKIEDDARKALPNPAKLWQWLLDADDDTVMKMMAVAVAGSVNAIRQGEPRKDAMDLHQAAGVNMADWWQPGMDGFLGRLNRADLDKAITEACGKDAAAKLPKKKAEAVAAAEQAMTGTGWLPGPLRAPVSAPAKKKPVAKKAAAKKAAAKKAKTKKPAGG